MLFDLRNRAPRRTEHPRIDAAWKALLLFAVFVLAVVPIPF